MYPLETKEFRQILLNLEMSNLSGQYEMLDSIMPAFKKRIQEQKEVPFVFLHLEYDELREDTLLMEYDEELKQLFILDPQGESPFITNELFIVGIPDSFYANSVRFVLDSNLYFTNTNEKPLSFEISFNEGTTWIPFDWGDTLTNAQSLSTSFHFKALFSGSINRKSIMSGPEMIFCDAGIFVPEPSLAPWNLNPNQFEYGNISASFTQSVNGVAMGNAYTWFRPNPKQGEENKYKKPVIIVEGLELGEYIQDNAGNYRMGDFGWCELWGAGDYPLDNMPDLLNDLHDNEYDIIMLDFKDNRRDIRENAYLLAELIQKINDYKTEDAEPNVVIGASMGGIVARFALRWMENHNLDHCTRLYISLDAPHRGAYISQGAQYMIQHLALNNVKKIPEAEDFYNILHDKAVRQMVRYNVTLNADQEFSAFYNELSALGYPQKTKNISIASGSKQGSTFGFNDGDRLFFASGSWNIPFFWRQSMNMEYYAIPGKSGNIIYDGLITAGVRIGFLFPIFIGPTSPLTKEFDEADQTCHDRIAGGYRPTARQLNRQFDDIDWVQTIVDHNNHSYVSLVSALDINTTNWYYNAINIVEDYPGPNLTPFDAIYAPSLNTEHVEITDGNQTGKGDNIEFALRQIKGGGSLPTVGNTLTSTYNYGSNTMSLITHELVENGGQMLLYGNQGDGDGSGQTPPSGNIHEYHIGNGDCHSKDLHIGENGELIIGTSTVNNQAILHINKESTLHIEDGGKLIIQDGSRLIVEDGGNFAFYEGAEIELQGPNSILEIRGKVTIGDNATFTFSGNGRIIMDQGIYPAVFDDFWDIGQDAKFDLQGSAYPWDQVVLEVKRNFSPKMSNHHTFELFRLNGCKVWIHPGKHISITGTGNLQAIDVDLPPSAGPNDKHDGIMLWGTNITFKYNTVKNATKGINAYQPFATSPLFINYVTFENCDIGVYIDGQSFEIITCTFEDNNIAVKAQNLHGTSKISNTEFTNNMSGADLHGQSGALTEISSCEFITNVSSSTTIGVLLEEHTAQITCSDFKNESTLKRMISIKIDAEGIFEPQLTRC